MAKRSRSEEEGAAGPGRERAGPPRARLFLALEPAEDERAALARWRDELVAGRDELRPVPSESLHLTLAFLGHRPEEEIPRIAEAAFAAIGDAGTVALEPRELKPVPPRSPRLFALDLADPGGAAAAIQAAVSEALARESLYTPEKRAWWPHVTLARVKRGVRAKPLRGEPPAEALRASTVTLYRSLLHPHGARYVPEARHDLP